VFYQPATVPVATLYPVTVEMWLQLASEAVNSIHEMTDAILKINALYVKEIERKALQSIYLSLFLLLSAIGLSFYTWRLVTRRVIYPVNTMAEALYRESKLSDADIPDTDIKDDSGLDEIAKLAQVLEVFRKNARQL